jgi:hypothetical protein
MNRRFFILDKFNTWYDWRCTVTDKDVPPADPKTTYINIEGANGSLDFSEALSGEPVYGDRKVTASFMCSEGTHKEREALLRRITTALHGRKVQIIEPDDPDHFFLGRVKIKKPANNLAYVKFDIEATCDPWRYAVDETTRVVNVTGSRVDVVINNDGDKTLCPVITVAGSVAITCNGVTTPLTTGTYKITDIRLTHGVNVVGVSGTGSAVFTYREAVL